MSASEASRVGVVVIGRNEGERLRACLASLAPLGLPIVYVDSDSSDGSRDLAADAGATVVSLDSSQPMNASRARREGAERLLADHGSTEFIAFIDGDCTVAPKWITTATDAMSADPSLAAVCGRRRELEPHASMYNLACDHEWDTPVGECDAVGGDSIWRVSAYQQAGGFDPTVPAGEEPELCQRVRQAGWRLQRLDTEMTTHDAAIHRFGPWWKRQLRTGYSGADVEHRFHLGLFDRLIRGSKFWAFTVPQMTVAAMLVAGWFGGWAYAGYVLLTAVGVGMLQTVRIARGVAGRPLLDRLKIATLTMLAKPAIALGARRYEADRRRGRGAKLLEYKSAPHSVAAQ
ncbi:MAG: glycosyltransferase [Planctomycetota bacterium]